MVITDVLLDADRRHPAPIPAPAPPPTRARFVRDMTPTPCDTCGKTLPRTLLTEMAFGDHRVRATRLFCALCRIAAKRDSWYAETAKYGRYEHDTGRTVNRRGQTVTPRYAPTSTETTP